MRFMGIIILITGIKEVKDTVDNIKKRGLLL